MYRKSMLFMIVFVLAASLFIQNLFINPSNASGINDTLKLDQYQIVMGINDKKQLKATIKNAHGNSLKWKNRSTGIIAVKEKYVGKKNNEGYLYLEITGKSNGIEYVDITHGNVTKTCKVIVGTDAQQPPPVPTENFKTKVLIITDQEWTSSKKNSLENIFGSAFELEYIRMKKFVAQRDELDGKYDVIAISEGTYSPNGTGVNPSSTKSQRTTAHNTTNVMNDITDLKVEEIISNFIDKGQLVLLHQDVFEQSGNGKLKANFSTYNTNDGSKDNVIIYSNNQDLASKLTNYYESDYTQRPHMKVTSAPVKHQQPQVKIYTPGEQIRYDFDVLNFDALKSENLVANLYFDADLDNRFEAVETVAVENVASAKGQLNYTLPSGFSGIRSWKLEVLDPKTGLKDYATGVFRFSDEKTVVNVLQVYGGSTGYEGSDSKLTDEKNMKQSYLVADDYEIQIDVVHIDQFNNASPDNPYSYTKINGKYDMIVFGFADVYNEKVKLSNQVADAIQEFINTGQSIMFTHDTIFKSDNAWVKYFMDDTGQIPPQTDLGYGAPNPSTETLKINDGIMNQFPFILDNNVKINTTHNQYYTLDLEDRTVIPWYNIIGSNRDQEDSWNHYYTYSKGNITYSGTGHTNSNFPDEEQRLFVNTMWKAFLGSNHAPDLNVYSPSEDAPIPTYQKTINVVYQVKDLDLTDHKLKTQVFVNGQPLTSTMEEVNNGAIISKTFNNPLTDEGTLTIKLVAEDGKGAVKTKEMVLNVEEIASNPEVSRTIDSETVETNKQAKITYQVTPKSLAEQDIQIPVTTMKGIRPFVVVEPTDGFQVGQSFDFKSDTHNGNFGYLDLEGSLAANIKDGYANDVSIGKKLATQTGNNNSVLDEVQSLLNKTITVPVIDRSEWNNVNGKKDVTVVKFATFEIIAVPDSHGQWTFTGKFLSYGQPSTLKVTNLKFKEVLPTNIDVINLPENWSKKGSLETGYTIEGTIPDITFTLEGDEYVALPYSFDIIVTPKLNGVYTLENATITYKDIDGATDMVVPFNPITFHAVTKVTGINLQESVSIFKGESRKLIATIQPENASNKALTWTSSDVSKVTVDASGVVKGIAVGSATVTVKSADGDIEAECLVTVQEIGTPVMKLETNGMILNDQALTNRTDITLTLVDVTSGQFKINDGEWMSYTFPTSLESLLDEGTYEIRGRKVILDGLYSNEAIQTIHIDRTAPDAPTITADPTTTTYGDVTVTIEGTEDTVKLEYRIDGGEWQEYTDSFIIDRNCTIEARGYDAAGNVSDISRLQISNIEKTADLSGLVVKNGTTVVPLSPEFRKDTLEYTATVGNSVSTVSIMSTPEDPDATVTMEVNGTEITDFNQVPLDVGANTIEITVTAQDGTEKTYTVTITRAASSNANLSNLVITDGEEVVQISPVFNPGTQEYTATVGNSVSSVSITPTQEDPNATVTMEVNGTVITDFSQVPLNVGANTIEITVTAQNGTTKTYTVTITRSASTNANLRGLVVKHGTTNVELTPAFTKTTEDYTARVGYDLTSVTVTPTVEDETATIWVNNETVESGADSSAIDLRVGENTITVTVKAQDGTTTQIYTVTITRAASSNANLSGLVVKNGTTVVPLSPEFAKDTLEYTATVRNSVSSVLITPTPEDPDATVTMKANGTVITDFSQVPLNVGVNTIEITVTAQDGTEKTYTVTITRVSTNANLSGLVVKHGTTNVELTPAFSKTTEDYTASVGYNVTSVTVTPTVEDRTATIRVDNETVSSGSTSSPIDLQVGENTITVTVTAQDGTTIKTYTVTITRAASANLSNLVVKDGEEVVAISPQFAKDTLEYTARVGNSVSSVSITPTLEDPDATVAMKANGTEITDFNQVALNVGTNTIEITVTAQDGTIKTYTVTINRVSTNANLSNLVVRDGTTEVLLSPVFGTNILAYTASVANSVNEVTVTPTAEDAMATIKVDGQTVASGATSDPIALKVGSNTITVVVTPQEGPAKTYTVEITRAEVTPKFELKFKKFVGSLAVVTIQEKPDKPNTIKDNTKWYLQDTKSGTWMEKEFHIGQLPKDIVVQMLTDEKGNLITTTIRVKAQTPGVDPVIGELPIGPGSNNIIPDDNKNGFSVHLTSTTITASSGNRAAKAVITYRIKQEVPAELEAEGSVAASIESAFYTLSTDPEGTKIIMKGELPTVSGLNMDSAPVIKFLKSPTGKSETYYLHVGIKVDVTSVINSEYKSSFTVFTTEPKKFTIKSNEKLK